MSRVFNRVREEFQSIIKRNSMILDDPLRQIRRNRVNLHYYTIPNTTPSEDNLGDYLSPIVVSYMLDRGGVSFDNELTSTKNLYAIGSILLMGYQNATIWGAGFPFEPGFLRSFPHRYPFRKLDVRAVRGPLTKRTLEKLGHKCSDNFGDPAILMPLIYNPSQDKLFDCLVIPHYSTETTIKKKYPALNFASMQTRDYKKVIDLICSSRKVISSSLHGVILAESYGVPAIYFQDRPSKFNYKVEDWYASTKRNSNIQNSLENALSIKPERIPDLSVMQKKLLDSFPYDIFIK